MPKAGELDWSYLEEHGHVERPEHPLSKPLKKTSTGKEAINDQFDGLATSIIADTPPQPTDEQLFGHLVPTEEEVKKAEYEYENRIRLGYEEALKPIDPEHDKREWGVCKSFKDSLTEEELKQYNNEERKQDSVLK